MINIQDIATGKYLVLPKDAKFNFEFENSLFANFDEIKGSFSYQLKISWRENVGILGNVGNPASVENYQKTRAVNIEVLGHFWVQSELQIESALVNQYFEVAINIDYADFKRKVGGKKLPEVVTGTYNLAKINTDFKYYSANCVYSEPPLDIYINISLTLRVDGVAIESVPIYVSPFPEELTDEQAVAALALLINEHTPAYDYTAVAEGLILKIIPKLDSTTYTVVVRKAYTNSSLAILNQDVSATQITYQKVDLQPEYDDFVFPAIRNENFYDKKNEDFLGALNVYNFGAEAYFQNNPTTRANLFAISAQLKVFAILDAICDYAGYTWAGSFKTNPELADLILYNTYADDAPRISSKLLFNAYSDVIEYKNHVPNISAVDFLNALQSVFCLYFRFNYRDKILYINLRKDKIKPTGAGENYQTKGLIGLENIERKKNIKLQYSKDDNEANFFESVTIGSYDDTETYEPSAGTLTYSAEHPAIDTQKGNSPMFDLGTTNEMKLRFLFWRGIVNEIPTATSAPSNDFDYSLEWNGAKGLYEQFWKDYVNFLLYHKTFSAEFRLDLSALKKMVDNLDAFLIEYDFLNYIVKSVDFDLNNTKNPFSQIAKMDLKKLPL